MEGRRDLPTGTVTFLFTDIEGSTRLLQRVGPRYPDLLADHDRLLRGAIAAGGGIEVNTEGDAFFAVFPSALGALRAAVLAQQAVFAHDWPDDATVKVRMGLHTGEGILGGSDYVGIDVNRAARVAAAGHGGQLLLSASTRGVVVSGPADGVGLLDLGEHRLKGLEAAEHIFQAVIPDLPAAFPPLRTEGGHPNNLPTESTLLIGREGDVEEIARLLADTRVVTLTGAGGTGKTRLAVAVGKRLVGEYPHGVFLVRLESLGDPDLVTTTVARTLGIVEGGDKPVADAVNEHLVAKRLLLVLDNFEHLMPAVDQVGRLLGASDGVRILVTSRMRLRISGEREYAVAPLDLPRSNGSAGVDEAMASEAVRLFVARAQEADHAFELTDGNVGDVVRIVNTLDGLPLALELAAARLRLLPPRQLLERLSDRLAVLTVGPSDAPDRHRTLRDAIAWSYELLGAEEQALFAHLGVFAGGFTLESAEAVASGGGAGDVLEGMGSLLDKSLLRRKVELDEEVRFQMLDSVLAYSRERLTESGRGDQLTERHGAYFLERALTAQRELAGAGRRMWTERLTLDHDDIRAVLTRSIESADPDTGLRIGAAIWRFWQVGGHLEEGRSWMERLLAVPGASPEARAGGMLALGGLAYWQGDVAAARRAYEEVLLLFDEVDDEAGRVEAQLSLGMLAVFRKDFEEAEARFAVVADRLDRLEGPTWLISATALAMFLMMKGDGEAARAELGRVVAVARAMGDTWGLSQAVLLAARTEFTLGEIGDAREKAREAMEIAIDNGDLATLAQAFEWLGAIAVGSGHPERGVRLAGAAQAVRDRTGVGLTLPTRGLRSPVEAAREYLGEREVEEAWQAGHGLDLAAALSFAREDGGDGEG